MFMHLEDTENLEKMIGGEIPEEVKQEYLLRATLFHKCGNGNGRLGPQMLIDMLRFLGIEPKATMVVESKVDWRTQISDGSVKVQVKDGRTGRYMGMLDGCSVIVRLDGEQALSQFANHAVSLFVPKNEPPLRAAMEKGAKNAKRS